MADLLRMDQSIPSLLQLRTWLLHSRLTLDFIEVDYASRLATSDWILPQGCLYDQKDVSKVWHQCLRRRCSEAGRLIKAAFRLKDGRLLSRYSQLWIEFIVSALSHLAGAIVGCFEDGGYWQFVYFM